MRVMIISNIGADTRETVPVKEDMSILNVLKTALAKYGIEYESLENSVFPLEKKDQDFSKTDIVIALGGDGTIIHVAKIASFYDLPVLGINCGHLGFMAGIEIDEIDKIKQLATGEYLVQKRMLIEVIVENKISNTENSFLSLNEIVVSRMPTSSMLEIEVSSGREKVIDYRADGMIVATPTGSSAYSFSAGGPIVDPAVECLLMTPICPHSFYARSYIFSENEILTIKAKSQKENAYLSVDGEKGIEIDDNDTITVKHARKYAKLISFEQKPFYKVMNQKLINRH